MSGQQGSWWGLHSVFEQSRQEFEAFASRPPVACPNCGEPLSYAPATKSGSGVERYCPYDSLAVSARLHSATATLSSGHASAARFPVSWPASERIYGAAASITTVASVTDRT